VNRAPIVIGSTAVGLGLILTFHTHSPTLAHASTSSPASTTPDNSAADPTQSASRGTSATTAPASSSTSQNAARSATSQDISYQYGDIQLKVSETGSRITGIEVVRNGADDPRSEEINSQAVPMLTSQALSAQSAQIDGVSGASFTSQAYTQALQSALDQLHG
jgi:uncharacterized protein with FMN-binding domain